MNNKLFSFFATSLVCFSISIHAAENSSNKKKSSSKKDENCGNLPIGSQRIEVRHIESKGIGYKQGYTTLEGFFVPPMCLEGSWVPFLDVRGHVFNNGKFGANTGLGLRYLTSQVWGINAYYDYRNTHRFHYNQVGAGLEMLGKLVDLRINGYLPVGKKTSKFYQTRFDGFENHYMLLSRKKEFSMKGANAEIGFHFGQFKRLTMYSAVGPYYFEGEGKVAWGGEGRFAVNIYDYLRLQVNGSYDKVFKGIVQGEVAVTIPFGKRKEVKKRPSYTCPQELLVKERALQRIDRQEIIVLDKKRKETIAINPETGQPYFFWFVDNTSHSSGTFESPFNTLLDAQNASSPDQIIYVFSGDGTSNGMNHGITLQSGQSLFGSGTSHPLITTLGLIDIPALTSNMPIINNTLNEPLGAAVILAGNTNVSGIHFDEIPTIAILGKGTADVSITNNLFTNLNTTDVDDFYAITFNGPGLSGTYTISSNTINQYLIRPNDTEAAGITFEVGERSPMVLSDNCQIFITNNNIDIRNGQGFELDSGGASQFNLTISGNAIFTENKAAIDLTTYNSSSATFNIYNNNVSDPGNKALSIVARDQSNINANVYNNVFSNAETGLDLSVGGSTSTNVIVLNAFNNRFVNNITEDFVFGTDNLPNIAGCVSLTNNIAPKWGFIFDREAPAILNLTKFEGNVGEIFITGAPITENPTCP